MGLRIPKIILLIINIVGGILVLGSYAYGIREHPAEQGALLWGGVPKEAWPIYGFSMILAAVGYFLFTFFILFKISSDVKIFKNLGFNVFHLIYLLILLPSAVWMPLTFKMIREPSVATWFWIRFLLAVVGLASLALLVALLSLDYAGPKTFYWLAVSGAVFFAFHTGVLDAIVWTFFFNPKI
ncbi:MAG: hypothetical protein GF370_03355 [Candidatus Nealsonbacteria bacterium]|nr:hypothetical protein [Candidatus Nealsonbacteria bacterium]